MSFDGDLYPEAGATSVMTTKGDIVRYDSQRERYGIGSTNQVLSVTAGLPAWKTLTLADSVLTTAGDILYENNTPELARLAKGSDGDVLTLSSGLPSWAAAGGGATVSTQQISPTANDTTSSTSMTDVSGGSATLANRSGGKAFCNWYLCVENSGNQVRFGFKYNGSDQEQTNQANLTSGQNNLSISCTDDTDGGTLQLRWSVNSGSATLRNGALEMSRCDILEVS